MGHSDHRAALERFIHRFVDCGFSFDVDVGGGFVDEHDFGWFQNSAGNADELPFSNTQILAIFGDFTHEPFSLLHDFLEGGELEGLPELLIRVFFEWIEILNK